MGGRLLFLGWPRHRTERPEKHLRCRVVGIEGLQPSAATGEPCEREKVLLRLMGGFA